MTEENEEENPDSNPFLRFSKIVDVERLNQMRVTIIGAGGIGAPAALALAKTGVSRLKICDFDRVGSENIGPQMYGPDDKGEYKVEVLQRFLKHQAPWTDVETSSEPYEGRPFDCDIVVAAVDSLQTRRVIWRGILQSKNQPTLLIDPRMAAEVLSVFCVDPKRDQQWYAHTLDGEAIRATCTAKATFYTGMVAGSMVAQVAKAYCG